MTDTNQTYTDDYVERLASLLAIKKEDGRWVDVQGSPLGGDLKGSVQQAIVRGWESVRVRQQVWESDLSTQRKVQLVDLLNMTERLIHMELHKDAYRGEDFMDAADRVADKARRLLGE